MIVLACELLLRVAFPVHTVFATLRTLQWCGSGKLIFIELECAKSLALNTLVREKCEIFVHYDTPFFLTNIKRFVTRRGAKHPWRATILVKSHFRKHGFAHFCRICEPITSWVLAPVDHSCSVLRFRQKGQVRFLAQITYCCHVMCTPLWNADRERITFFLCKQDICLIKHQTAVP